MNLHQQLPVGTRIGLHPGTPASGVTRRALAAGKGNCIAARRRHSRSSESRYRWSMPKALDNEAQGREAHPGCAGTTTQTPNGVLQSVVNIAGVDGYFASRQNPVGTFFGVAKTPGFNEHFGKSAES